MAAIQTKGGRGVANQFINDSVPYGKRLPNHKPGMITVRKTPKHHSNDAFASDKAGL